MICQWEATIDLLAVASTAETSTASSVTTVAIGDATAVSTSGTTARRNDDLDNGKTGCRTRTIRRENSKYQRDNQWHDNYRKPGQEHLRRSIQKWYHN